MTAVAFDPRGRVVAAGGKGGLFLWSVGSARLLSHLRVPDGDGSVTALAYGPDGAIVAGTSSGALWRWRGSKHDRASLGAIPGPITAVAVAKDGSVAYASRHSAFVRRRSARSAVPLAQAPADVFALAFSPTAPTLAVGGGTVDGPTDIGLVDLFDTRTLARTGATPTDPGPSDFVESLSFAGDGSTLAGCGPDGTVWLWDGTHR